MLNKKFTLSAIASGILVLSGSTFAKDVEQGGPHFSLDGGRTIHADPKHPDFTSEPKEGRSGPDKNSPSTPFEIAKKVAQQAMKTGVGLWVDGKWGNLIKGGPWGFGAGILLTPTHIGKESELSPHERERLKRSYNQGKQAYLLELQSISSNIVARNAYRAEQEAARKEAETRRFHEDMRRDASVK